MIITEEVAELPEETPKGEQQIERIINNMKEKRETNERIKRMVEE